MPWWDPSWELKRGPTAAQLHLIDQDPRFPRMWWGAGGHQNPGWREARASDVHSPGPQWPSLG